MIYNERNVGFAAGQNQAIRESRGDWVLCLNPDVVMSSDCVAQLVSAGEAHPEAGSICGKLLRGRQLREIAGPTFSIRRAFISRATCVNSIAVPKSWTPGSMTACSMSLEPRERRRCSGGVSLTMFLSKIEFFDEEFFSFREDADLAWRAQVLGWKCVYVPMAVAWHARRVTPERRRDLPLIINWHSVKNRFLMRGKNASGWLCRQLLLSRRVARHYDGRLCLAARLADDLGRTLSVEGADQHSP